MTIHEPATLVTDYLLAFLGMFCGWRLGRFPTPARRWWSRSLWLSGAAALVGGTFHGFGPILGEPISDALWRATLALLNLTSAAMSLTLVEEIVPAPARRMWSLAVWLKFAGFLLASLLHPTFLVAIIDYGSSMLALAGAAMLTKRAWRGAMLAAVALSVCAAIVQQAGWDPSPRFNHNDLYHVIQGLAIFLFYRAGCKVPPPVDSSRRRRS